MPIWDLVWHLLDTCLDLVSQYIEVVESGVRPDVDLLVTHLLLRIASSAVDVVDVLVSIYKCILDYFWHAS